MEVSDLADFCEWQPDGSRRPCYAPASMVLVGEVARATAPGGDRASHRDCEPYRLAQMTPAPPPVNGYSRRGGWEKCHRSGCTR